MAHRFNGSALDAAPVVISNFTPPLRFLNGKTLYSSTNITGALTISLDLTGAIPGAVSMIRLVANGTNIPTFTASFKSLGTNVWTNTAGTVNLIQFLYDGTDVWYNILPQPGTAAPTTTLSNFAVNTDGTQFTYSATLATQGLTGNLTVAGSPRTLTYVSSGVSSISGATVKVGEVCTFTLTESLPASATTITNAAVTNNSTVPAGGGLTQRALNFTLNSGATVNGDNVTLPAMGATAVSSYAINAAQPFEIVFTPAQENIVMLLETDTSNPGGFGTLRTQTVLCAYWADGNVSYSRNNATATLAHTGTLPLRLTKNGNDVYIEVLYLGTWYPANQASLATGVLSGATNMYLKVEVRAGTNLTTAITLKT